MNSQHLYKSILYNLSQIPEAYLQRVNIYLEHYNKELKRKQKNKQAILGFAGSWNDLSNEEFKNILTDFQNNRNQMFNRNFEI